MPDVASRVNDTLYQFLLDAGKLVGVNFACAMRFFGINFYVSLSIFTMKLFRNRHVTMRNENPQPDIRTPSFSLFDLKRPFLRPSPTFRLIDFSRKFSFPVENCNLIPQRNCDRFSRSSLLPRIVG